MRRISLFFLLVALGSNAQAQNPQGFFLNDYSYKTPIIPPSAAASKPVKPATVTIQIDTNQVINKVSKYLFGNNANAWATRTFSRAAFDDLDGRDVHGNGDRHDA